MENELPVRGVRRWGGQTMISFDVTCSATGLWNGSRDVLVLVIFRKGIQCNGREKTEIFFERHINREIFIFNNTIIRSRNFRKKKNFRVSFLLFRFKVARFLFGERKISIFAPHHRRFHAQRTLEFRLLKKTLTKRTKLLLYYFNFTLNIRSTSKCTMLNFIARF